MSQKHYRDAITGEYVTADFAHDHPETTVSETHRDDVESYDGDTGAVIESLLSDTTTPSA